MDWYVKIKESVEVKHGETLQRLKDHRELISIAAEYAEEFSENHEEWSLERRLSRVVFSGLQIELKLSIAKGDRAEAAHSIIDKMIKDPRLDMAETPPKILHSSLASWEFVPKGSTSYYPRLDVDVSYSSSEFCKLVGTGRFAEPIEIREMKCE